MRVRGQVAVGVIVTAIGIASACIIEPPIVVGRPPPEPPPDPDPETRPGRNCDRDFDCFINELCVEELCTVAPPCVGNADCFTGVCLDGLCTGCFRNDDCDSGSICGDDNRCETLTRIIDFEYDIMPLFDDGNCVACHHTGAPSSAGDLRFDVERGELFSQLLLESLVRVRIQSPAESTIITAPLREDPPNHPVGVWNPGGPEEGLLVDWIRAGAAEVDQCRHLTFGDRELDCVFALAPENVCREAFDSALLAACDACDPQRFAGIDLSVCVVDAGVVDAGVTDAGVVDAGVVDAGVTDAGVVDAGVADAGVVDAGVVDAG